MASILDHPLVAERYFFPRHFAVSDPCWVEVKDARLSCFHAQRGNDLTVVHFHGNGEVAADYVPDFVDLMDELGADCFLAEYRGYGGSSGSPQLVEMLDDVDAIFEAVGRPAEEIVVFGRSVGSIYALELAARHPDVAGLVIESGVADPLERVLLRVRPEELGTTLGELQNASRERLDHARKLQHRTNPTLIMHAQHDTLVDASNAARLSSCPPDNVKFVLLPHGDHNTVFGANRERYLQEVGALFELIRSGGSYGSMRSAAPPELGHDPFTALLRVRGIGMRGAESTVEVRPTSEGVRIDASVVGRGEDWSVTEVWSRPRWSVAAERIHDAVAIGAQRFGGRPVEDAGRVYVALGGSPPRAFDRVGGKDDHARRVAVQVMRIIAELGGPTASVLLPAEPDASQLRSADDTVEVGTFDPGATAEYGRGGGMPRRGPGETKPLVQIPSELLRRGGPGDTAELEQKVVRGDRGEDDEG